MTFSKKFLAFAVATATLTLAACDGDDGNNGDNGRNSLISQTQLLPGDVNCSFGGVQIDSGLDANANGELDDSEITDTSFVCNPADSEETTTLLASLRAPGATLVDIPQGALGTAMFSSAGVADVAALELTTGFGSGAFHMRGESAVVFYTITDRGPNIGCDDAEDILGIAEFCGIDNDSDKIFPQLNYTPKITQWRLVNGESGVSAEIIQEIELRDQDGNVISGITNNLQAATTELSFDNDGNQIAFDNNGLDPESLVKLSDGTFWISDEYGPSLVHVASDGTILERVVPQSVAADLASANYPVTGGLPDVYRFRQLNRGIESIAVSPNEDFLYFIMQSPLANTTADIYRNSRHVRLMKYALNSDGTLGAAVGEYVYVLDRPQTFGNAQLGGDITNNFTAVRISEMTALDTDQLLVLERGTATTKLYEINLATAENILGTDLSSATVTANESSDPRVLENVFDLVSFNATPVAKALAFNTLTDLPENLTAPTKLEGIALLDDDTILLINDNDFGITGEQTQLLVMSRDAMNADSVVSQTVRMEAIATFTTVEADPDGAAEIVTFDSAGERVFVVNAVAQSVDVLDASGLSNGELTLIETLDLVGDLAPAAIGNANSVSVFGNLLAVAIEADNTQDPGFIAFYDVSGEAVSFINAVQVGALPDMVTFTPDGSKVLSAGEGEPSSDYSNDPIGTVAIINITNGVPATSATLLDFTAFNEGGARRAEFDENIRIFGPNASVAQDLEPEYIAVASDSQTAYVGLQENNAIAVIDLADNSIASIHSLGTKDFSIRGNQLDASDRDDAVNFQNYNIVGIYQPDAIAAYSSNGFDFVVTANEGDARDYDTFSEEIRVEDLVDGQDLELDPNHPEFENAGDRALLGRLEITNQDGDDDGDGDIDTIHTFGARSFSIWNPELGIVFDSGDDLGKLAAGRNGLGFNNNDSRSDSKGAEPEAVDIGVINGRTYAFIGAERSSDIYLYDITSAFAPQFIQLINNPGDERPEGMEFVPADRSPTGEALLVVGHELSGTTTVYEITVRN